MSGKRDLVDNHHGGQSYWFDREDGVYIRHESLRDEVSHSAVEYILLGREAEHPSDAECDPAQRLVRNDHSYGGCTIRVWTRDGKMIHMEINVV